MRNLVWEILFHVLFQLLQFLFCEVLYGKMIMYFVVRYVPKCFRVSPLKSEIGPVDVVLALVLIRYFIFALHEVNHTGYNTPEGVKIDRLSCLFSIHSHLVAFLQ